MTASTREKGEEQRTVLFFSPDLDFCMSFRMIFQDSLHLVTTTDAAMLSLTASALQPDILIADSAPCERLRAHLTLLRRHVPGLRVLLLCPDDKKSEDAAEAMKECIDATLGKPFDLNDLRASLDRLLSERPEEV